MDTIKTIKIAPNMEEIIYNEDKNTLTVTFNGLLLTYSMFFKFKEEDIEQLKRLFCESIALSSKTNQLTWMMNEFIRTSEGVPAGKLSVQVTA